MSLNIRKAEPNDALLMAEFAAQRFTDTFSFLYPPKDLQEFLQNKYNKNNILTEIKNKHHCFYIAEIQGEIKGYIYGGEMTLPYETNSKTAKELYRLYISDDAKGTGLAQALFNILIDYTKKCGANELYLGVWYKNERAIKFYQNQGFEIVGRYDYYVGNTIDDERIMRLKIV